MRTNWYGPLVCWCTDTPRGTFCTECPSTVYKLHCRITYIHTCSVCPILCIELTLRSGAVVDVMELRKELYYEFLHHNLAVYHLAMRVFQLRTSLASLQHLHILQDMLKDYALGEHLLLVGNQVGACAHTSSSTRCSECTIEWRGSTSVLPLPRVLGRTRLLIVSCNS